MDCGSKTMFRRVLPMALVGSGAIARLGFGGAASAGTPAGVVWSPASTQDSVPATAPQRARASAQDLPSVSPAQRDAREDLDPNVADLPLGGVANVRLPQTSGAAQGPVP